MSSNRPVCNFAGTYICNVFATASSFARQLPLGAIGRGGSVLHLGRTRLCAIAAITYGQGVVLSPVSVAARCPCAGSLPYAAKPEQRLSDRNQNLHRSSQCRFDYQQRICTLGKHSLQKRSLATGSRSYARGDARPYAAMYFALQPTCCPLASFAAQHLAGKATTSPPLNLGTELARKPSEPVNRRPGRCTFSPTATRFRDRLSATASSRGPDCRTAFVDATAPYHATLLKWNPS